MKIKVFSCLVAVLLLFCSCGTGDTSDEAVDASSFPATPDKIIVGAEGTEKELLPDDEAFDQVVSGIKKRTEDVRDFGALLLDAYDPETEMHMSDELRDAEVFVEFIYNDVTTQIFTMGQSGGGSAPEKKDVIGMFFPLTGEYHCDFFVAKDADYKQSETLGILPDNTGLITYVRGLVSAENANK